MGCDIYVPDTLLMAEEIARLRYSLTPSEVERFRWLGERVSQAVEKTLMEASQGEKESEVVGRLCREMGFPDEWKFTREVPSATSPGITGCIWGHQT